jgi:hypothetical protein
MYAMFTKNEAQKFTDKDDGENKTRGESIADF